MPPAKELELLLAEESGMRALAARLASDAGAADDLVQETYLAALSSGTRPRSIRAWLARILRNRWRDQVRSAGRRTSRELSAARPEALPSSDELVAEVELRKRVAEAVLALEEPLRRTIVLRFFHGRTLESIASDEGTSVSSIHARERRGLERLRAELDRIHGGRRERWMAVLIPLAEHTGVAAVSAGGVAMASGVKIAASILAIGAGAVCWLVVQRRESGAGVSAASAGISAPAPMQVEEALVPLNGSRPGRVAEERSEPSAVAEARKTIAGRVLDPEGNGMPGVVLGWHDPRDGDARAESDADGGFRLDCGRSESAEHGRVDTRSPGLVTLIPGQAHQGWTVIAGSSVSCAGRVVDEMGAPVVGATVAFRARDGLFRAVGLHAIGFEDEGRSTTSDAQGRFQLDGVCGGSKFWLRVQAIGFADARVALPEGGSQALVVSLQRLAHARELTGLVLDPAGSPVQGARVSAGEDIVSTDASGHFVLPWTGWRTTFVDDGDGRWREDLHEDATLIALGTGYLPESEKLTGRNLALPFVLRLGPAPLSIAGVVRDPSGTPRPGIVVWVSDPTHFGAETELMDEGTASGRPTWVETMTCGSSLDLEPIVAAITDDSGRFEIGCLMARTYSVLASDPRTASRSGPWSIAAGTDAAELVLRDEPTVRVAGRLVSARGAPRAGLRITPRRTETWRIGAEPPALHGADPDVTTDDEGRFEFPALATSGTTLSIMGANAFELVPTRLPLSDFSDLSSVEIVVPVQCEALVESSGAVGDSIRMLDEEGGELEIHEVTGMEGGFMMSATTTVRLVGGRSRLLLVAETASTLVVLKEDREVARVPIRLEPGERTVLRP